MKPARAARLLTQALAQEKDVKARQALGESLAAVAGRLEPVAAGRLLNQALAEEKDDIVRLWLTEGLAAVARRLRSPEAARTGAEAARFLNRALAQEKNGKVRAELALRLATVADGLAPADAAHVRAEAARSYIQALDLKGNENVGRGDADNLLQLVDVEQATHLARVFVREMVAEPDFLVPYAWVPLGVGSVNFDLLERFLTSVTRPQVRQRAVASAAAIGTSANGPALSLPFLPAANEPLPCRLTTQDLVELLKMPTCVADVRRVILNKLGNRYSRRFPTHWDFVRYAQEQELNLDFTTPPLGPDANSPPLFQE
jgi:hypothetical protein